MESDTRAARGQRFDEPRIRALARSVASCALAAALAACSSLPARPPLAPTHAIADTARTPLSQIADQALPGDTRSGFRLLPYGPNSLAARVELAALATRSLDVQYYLLQADNTGLTLLRALREAAARGVRVRLLVDDLYTSGEDDVLLAMARLPNVEVRLFSTVRRSRPERTATCTRRASASSVAIPSRSRERTSRPCRHTTR